MASQEFVSQFYNLEGVTVDERRRNLFHLFNTHASLPIADLDAIVAILKPRNHLEQIFWVEFLIFFKRCSDLYGEFKKGNEITITKIAKHSWFFHQIFDEVDPETFVNDVLPTMSFAVRMKILKKLRVNEEKSDQIFDALHRRYGIFTANNVLHRCSVAKIRKILDQEPVKLTLAQLQQLFCKDPSLLTLYLEQNKKLQGNANFMNNHPIFVYVARRNPRFFCELRDKFEFAAKLGGRTTRKFVKSTKEEVLAKPDEYVKILRRSCLVRALGVDFKTLLLRIFPETTQELPQSQAMALLNCYAKKGRFNLYKATYNAIFRKKFGEDLDLVGPNVLEMMLEVAERQNLAENLLKKTEDDSYLKFFCARNCIRAMKKKFNLSTAQQRIAYVELMTQSCVLNEDLDALLELTEFLSSRLKNDDPKILANFFKRILDNKSLAEKLTENHWNLFYKMLLMIYAKNSLSFTGYEYVFRYIEFLFVNNKAIDDVVLQFGHEAIYNSTDYPVLEKNPKLCKTLLLLLIKTDPNRTEERLRRFHISIIDACRSYNSRNPHDQIPLLEHPKLYESCERILVKKENEFFSYTYKSALNYLVRMKSEADFVTRLQELYFNSLRLVGKYDTLLWFLKNSPDLVQRHLIAVLETYPIWSNYKSNRKVWNLFKQYSNLDLDKKTVEFYLMALEENKFSNREIILETLSILMQCSEYIEFAKLYKPTPEDSEAKDQESRDLVKIKLKVLYYLKNYNPPQSVLPTVIEFATTGDCFLATALAPLYSLCSRVPENELNKTVEKLDSFKGVSVKKHGVILTCVNFDQASVLACLTNTSIPSLLHGLKFFVKNPSDALWELVKTDLSKIDKTNTEMLQLVTEIIVPLKFRSEYNAFLWDLLGQKEKISLRKNLLPKMLLEDTELCSKVIKDSLMEFRETEEFAANFLVETGNFEIVTEILRELKHQFWIGENMRKVRNKVIAVICKFFVAYMESKLTNKEFVANFLVKFQEIFDATEAFREVVLLNLATFKGETVENIAGRTAKLTNDLNKVYGPTVLHLFADSMTDSLQYFFKKKSERFQFCCELLKSIQSEDENLLVFKLLPDWDPEDDVSVKCNQQMMDTWRVSNNKTVQLQYNLYGK